MKSKMLPNDVVENLTHGSYEDIVQRVGLAITEAGSKFIGEGAEDVKAFPVATFKNYVVVGTSDGKFFRAKYAETQAEGIEFKNVDKIDVHVVDETNMRSFIDGELGKALDEFFAGNAEAAFKKVRDVASIVEATETNDSVQAAKKLVETLHGSDWVPYVRSKVRELTGIVSFEPSQTRPIFQQITDGQMTDDQLAKLADNVNESMKTVFTKTKEALKVAELAYAGYREASPNATEEQEKSAILKFEALAEGFMSGVGAKLHEAHKIVENDDCLVCKAVLHDGFAEILDDVRLASGFVVHFSNNLKN